MLIKNINDITIKLIRIDISHEKDENKDIKYIRNKTKSSVILIRRLHKNKINKIKSTTIQVKRECRTLRNRVHINTIFWFIVYFRNVTRKTKCIIYIDINIYICYVMCCNCATGSSAYK